MPENKVFPPEGLRPPAVHTLQALKSAAESGEILEAVALRCDVNHTLHFSLNGIRAVMHREEVNAPWISGADRDIAIFSPMKKVLRQPVSADGRPRRRPWTTFCNPCGPDLFLPAG